MSKRALITGITGQDGSYLAELLLAHGYEVSGLVRDESSVGLSHIAPIKERLQLIKGDLREPSSLLAAIELSQPQEVYNLGAQTVVHSSWDQIVETGVISGLGVAHLLEAIRTIDPQIRFYQASSSELYGKVEESPQSEQTPFRPRSPYGTAKLYAHWLTTNYRQHYNMFASAGILFNHESPRRGPDFVTRKITRGVARIKLGLEGQLRLGNLDTRRDWGVAGDYVEAMWRMLQVDTPADFVIATGVDRSVRDFCRLAFASVGLDWEQFVVVDPRFFRVEDGEILVGNSAKAREELGWQPQTPFEDIVETMVAKDIEEVAEKAA